MTYDPERRTPILIMPCPTTTRSRDGRGYDHDQGEGSTLIFVLDDEIVEQFRKAYPAKKAPAA